MSLLGERQYEEALSVFMEGLGIAQKEVLGERVLSTFHDHVAHTILQLRQQRACHQFLLVCIHLLYAEAATLLPKPHTNMLHVRSALMLQQSIH